MPDDDGIRIDSSDTFDGGEERFVALREAVLLASDEKPGWRCDAVLVVSVWVKDPPEPGHPAEADMFCTPTQRLPDLLRVVRSMPPIPGGTDG